MKPLRIGITCYPSIGGSGILASALGEELARRGHQVHFISYERPVRMPDNLPGLHFHPVVINDYGLFKYPDYTLPLSVKMSEVSREFGLDVLHVHYAVPHATAAILARSMISRNAPKVVTTLHGTDTTLLGKDPGYGPAIRHALAQSDGVTTVSAFLERETRRLLEVTRRIEVIHNFFSPKPARRSRDETRSTLGLAPGQVLLFHASNLRPLKRIDLLLEAASHIRPAGGFKLLILAGDSFEPHRALVHRLGLDNRVLVREGVADLEDYLAAADIGLFSSETESFCLSILEGMFFGCPSVSTEVGGIPEVVEKGVSGVLVEAGNARELARGVESLMSDPAKRAQMGQAAKHRAEQLFSAGVIVPRYEAYYRRICEGGGPPKKQ